ncbi:PLP-dependent aminotransferase family protein [Acetobacter sp.]|uniref:MocR-like pyridoxine biosynthesis transcription factor PdxR n=1 Tax=Acetobacter sp. TaxID=440 RepID=UPI0039E8E231
MTTREIPMIGMAVDRNARSTLTDQIAGHIKAAILDGSLPPGARLPSWRDLAAQLGVARGTIRAAYQKLVDQRVLYTAGSAGTLVALTLPTRPAPALPTTLPMPGFEALSTQPLPFQMGIPARDAFPATLWARLHRQAVQSTTLQTGHSDPRGLPELRSAIASHVALARGIDCSPDNIIVTTGYRSGLASALHAIGASGRQAWIENPGFPVTRRALEVAGVYPVAVHVDADGMDVAYGRDLAPGAALAIVTPGQQAPTGVTLSPARRCALQDWTQQSGAWIVEDDYLGELHLDGRAPNALASGSGADRVIHIGTFSKTLAPMVGLGFIVAPPALLRRLTEVASWLGTPPNLAVQATLTRFLREGHYLRHLRRMRTLYVERRQLLMDTLVAQGAGDARAAGLSVLLPLPNGFDDERLALNARGNGLAPAPLSPWFASASRARAGLVLGIANVRENHVAQDCATLLTMARRV